jgi:hypothetical protein
VDFVRADRDQVRSLRNPHPAIALHRVAEQQAAFGMGGFGISGDRLDRADLIVDQHQRDDTVFGQVRVVGRRHQPVRVDRDQARAFILEPLQGAVMLDRAPGEAAGPEPGAGDQSPVQRLGRARGEIDPPAAAEAPRQSRASSTADRRGAARRRDTGSTDWRSRRCPGPDSQGSIASSASGASGVVA